MFAKPNANGQHRKSRRSVGEAHIDWSFGGGAKKLEYKKKEKHIFHLSAQVAT
jgi:hypothetical protein